MKEIKEIRERLKEKAEKESIRLFRLARKADRHGCNGSLVEEIQNEARRLHTTAQAYPDRMIAWEFDYDFKYAFRLGGK